MWKMLQFQQSYSSIFCTCPSVLNSHTFCDTDNTHTYVVYSARVEQLSSRQRLFAH
jgi:hypothetical protein